mmetsp:Transcript_64856/g.141323  ORF Transcript_64856/g.141323 Transcript_64856/m.141323 type:complete len:89 (-) Transcript_64856:25-291(-)
MQKRSGACSQADSCQRYHAAVSEPGGWVMCQLLTTSTPTGATTGTMVMKVVLEVFVSLERASVKWILISIQLLQEIGRHTLEHVGKVR